MAHGGQEPLREGLRIQGDSDSAWWCVLFRLGLALAHAHLGHEDEARATYAAALEMWPERLEENRVLVSHRKEVEALLGTGPKRED